MQRMQGVRSQKFLAKLLPACGCAFLTGCMVTTTPLVKGLTNVREVELGMLKEEVQKMMGTEVVIGYDRSDNQSATFAPVTVKNPIRSENLKAQGKTYEVIYYFTQINDADGTINDDELTPMVFEKNKLIGKGWDFLSDLKKKNNAVR